MKTSKQRFLHKLGEQIQFLERSCQFYDGEESEAIRIFTSLIEHLGFKKRKMLSTARGFHDWQDYLKVQINLNTKTPVKMLPMLKCPFSSGGPTRRCSSTTGRIILEN